MCKNGVILIGEEEEMLGLIESFANTENFCIEFVDLTNYGKISDFVK